MKDPSLRGIVLHSNLFREKYVGAIYISLLLNIPQCIR